MTTQIQNSDEQSHNALSSWLNKPIRRLWGPIGWIGSTSLFIGLIAILGGPSESDASESAYATWAIAHGHLACAYPTATTVHFPNLAGPGPFIAPLYPLLSAAVAALARIGNFVSFPTQAQLGPHCSQAYVAMFKWSVYSSAIVPTIKIGYIGWFALMIGVVTLLRASGRGRRRWEPMALLLLAIAGPVLECILDYYHPQDLLTIGLVLGGLAFAKRARWVGAGALFGLAVITQQFALLALAPMLVVDPANRRLKFVAAAIAAAAVFSVPLIIFTSGRAIKAVLIGSGYTRSYGGTVLWELHLHGATLFIFSRLLPVILALALAWWAARRLGPVVLEPTPLISLIATTLCFRLVFEENLFGYYFMAITVMLVVLDVVRGRLRGYTVAWIALATLAFDPVPWGFNSNGQSWGLSLRLALPIAFAVIALMLILIDALRHCIRWYLVAWLALVALTLVKMPWMHGYLRHSMPIWFWQVILVTGAVVLAVGPLLSKINDVSDPTPEAVDALLSA